MANSEQAAAREFFPRGLHQPEGAFRFSLDALLLSAFAHRQRPGWSRLADLGCGVGPVALGALLMGAGNKPARMALGLDNRPVLIEAARKNADLLGFSDEFQAETMDLRDGQGACAPGGALHDLAGTFDLVCANPPYRSPGSGRMPLSELRRNALFGDSDTLNAFARGGAFLLSPLGAFCLIMPRERLNEMKISLHEHGLRLRAILPVSAEAEREPILYLLAADHGTPENNGIDCQAEKPLVLYSAVRADSRSISAEALEFCPFLLSNA